MTPTAIKCRYNLMWPVTPTSAEISLLFYYRPLRGRLDKFANEVRKRLLELRGIQQPDSAERLAMSTCMNLAALVIASTGHLPIAKRLCELHLSWVAQLVAAGENSSLL